MKIDRIKRRGKSELILEMTPLIDVVFLLLIFFLIATTFDEKGGIQVDLPKSTVKEVKVLNNVQVIVDKNKKVFIAYKDANKRNTVEIKRENLKKELSKKLSEAETKNVVISADRSVEYEFVIDIITVAKEAGAVSLDLDTTKN